MKKRLYYFTEDAIRTFKANQEKFCEEMRKHPKDIDWVDSFYGKKAMVASQYEFDFAFKPYDKKSVNEDYDNAVALYELFEENNIGPATIFNEQFLTGFVFTFGYEYFMNVIGADATSHVFGTLFYDEGMRRNIARNTIGRLYRYVQLTVDDNLADRYELTKFAFQNKNLFRMRYYTYLDGKKTRMAYFKAFKEWVYETHKDIKLDLVNKVMTHISILGNINDTDLMDESELIKYIKEYIKRVDLKLA